MNLEISLDAESSRRWLQGEPAVWIAQQILAAPGLCCIDFETWPTDPKWHGEQAAKHAPRGQQVAARKQAVQKARLDGRAHRRQACTLQLHHEDGREAFLRLTDPASELPAMFAGRQASLVAHNAAFETEVLLRYGVEADVECTLIAAKCLYLVAVPEDEPQPVSFGLADLVRREFGRSRDKTIRDRDWRDEASLDMEAVAYGLADARDCLDLWRLYERRLRDAGLWDGYKVMQSSILPTAAVNVEGGLHLDAGAHARLMTRMRETADDAEADLSRICHGNIDNHGSDQQVSTWIIEQVLGYCGHIKRPEHVDDPYRMSRLSMRLTGKTNGVVKGWRTTATGYLSLRRGSSLRKAEALRQTYPEVSAYLFKRAHWRKAQKLLDAFGSTLLVWQDGPIRGQHKVFGAWTGRQSCTEPNLQQQPHDKEFRALWIAVPGRKLVIADYSQIELRLLAIEARDERLMDVYRAGRDVHQETANIAGIDRQTAKSVNFAMAYGSGAAGLSENFGFDLDESRRILAYVLGAYHGLAAYRQRAPALAAAHGYISIRPCRRVVYETSSPGTTAINAPIQGGAASVQNRALRLVHDELRGRPWIDVRLAAAVHDEIILDSDQVDADDAARTLVGCMTRALVEIYPEAEAMGMANLTAASVVDSWSEKA